MTTKIVSVRNVVRVAAGVVFLGALSGCTTTGSNPPRASGEQPAEQTQSAVSAANEYVYFPRYEIYYSRTQRDYVYRDGLTWIRRPEPRTVTVATLHASPSVELDFQDAPSRHHHNVLEQYPKDWAPPVLTPAPVDDRRADMDGHHADEDERRNERNSILVGDSP